MVCEGLELEGLDVDESHCGALRRYTASSFEIEGDSALREPATSTFVAVTWLSWSRFEEEGRKAEDYKAVSGVQNSHSRWKSTEVPTCSQGNLVA